MKIMMLSGAAYTQTSTEGEKEERENTLFSANNNYIRLQIFEFISLFQSIFNDVWLYVADDGGITRSSIFNMYG
jgi:hypothetical protein